MTRKGRNDESRALTGTGVVEGTDADNTQTLIRHDSECEVRGGLGCAVYIQWGQSRAFRKGMTGPEAVPVRFGTGGEQKKAVWHVIAYCIRQAECPTEVDRPCIRLPVSRALHGGNSGQVDTDVGFGFLDHRADRVSVA